MASRKDYIETAEDFGRLLADLRDDSETSTALMIGLWASCRDLTADVFQRNNPRFDRAKFVAHTLKFADDLATRRADRAVSS